MYVRVSIVTYVYGSVSITNGLLKCSNPRLSANLHQRNGFCRPRIHTYFDCSFPIFNIACIEDLGRPPELGCRLICDSWEMPQGNDNGQHSSNPVNVCRLERSEVRDIYGFLVVCRFIPVVRSHTKTELQMPSFHTPRLSSELVQVLVCNFE